MRYLVRARVKQGRERALLQAIEEEKLGAGSVAGDEYLRNMNEARLCDDGTARWVEVCYGPTPLQEERPYWEEYFELQRVQDAHDRRRCKDYNGTESWACGECDCTEQLEKKLAGQGKPFLVELRKGNEDSWQISNLRNLAPGQDHNETAFVADHGLRIHLINR